MEKSEVQSADGKVPLGIWSSTFIYKEKYYEKENLIYFSFSRCFAVGM